MAAEKVVIIGSGPAGWTAAIYAARANLSPLVYEGAISEDNRLRGTLPLGQLNLTTEVENYPGFPEGVIGPDLMMRMRTQAERYGTRIVTEDIVSIDLKSRPFSMTDSAGATLQAHAVIISTGASANYLGLESPASSDVSAHVTVPFATLDASARLTVNGTIADDAITLATSGNNVAVSVNSVAGLNYRLEYKNALTDPS